MGDVFPRYYRPRPYQAELHQMWQRNRVGLAVYPRQSGKDVAMSMESCTARLLRPKTTGVYIAPDTPSVRNILWDKTYWDPNSQQMVRMLQDNVPDSQVSWKDTRMEGRFTNKSILKLEGYFQSGKDQNGVGTSFDDYSITELSLFTRDDPIPRLMPIITSEQPNKRLMGVATPRGKRRNPLWALMSALEGQPNYQIIIRTIDDLNEIMRRHGLPPVRSQQQLELDKEAYLRRFGNARMFEQEYYCSFEEMDAAAVYGEALSRIMAEHRNRAFNWDRGHPIYVAFDIGSSGKHSDATAWIAFQWFNNNLFLIDCGEGHGKALPEYVDVLAMKPWYSQLAQIILPWDGDHHETAVNTTPADMMRQRFPNVAVLAKGTNIWTVKGLPNTDNADIITMVQQVRLQMYKTFINGLDENNNELKSTLRPNCDWLLECMENYKYSFNEKTGEYSPTPVHDKYSHMMDALRYVVQAIKELGFFGGSLYDNSQTPGVGDYIEDYSGVWN
jgi:hypothetical protein